MQLMFSLGKKEVIFLISSLVRHLEGTSSTL